MGDQDSNKTELRSGYIVKVTNDFNPAGLVPIKHMRLLYQTKSGKWYAHEVESNEYVSEINFREVIRLAPPK